MLKRRVILFYLVMREPRFSSAHTHSWTTHRDPSTTKSKPPHSSHIASSHQVTGTLSKARGKRVVKHVFSERAPQSVGEPAHHSQAENIDRNVFQRCSDWLSALHKNRVLEKFFVGWMIYRIINIWEIIWTFKCFFIAISKSISVAHSKYKI